MGDKQKLTGDKNLSKTDDIFKKSGMITHLKTVQALKNDGWSINVSSYYYDNVGDQVKEIDIIAEKRFNSAPFGSESTHQLNIQLFIECKYINSEFLVWFDQINQKKLTEALESKTGLWLLSAGRGGADISNGDLHYLQDSRAAKLFSTVHGAEDVVYKAISQCLRALVYYEQWADGPIFHKFNVHRETKGSIMRYPIIVCGNFENLKEVVAEDDVSKATTKPIDNNFLIETNYVYPDKGKVSTSDDYFLIDVVNVENFGTFLKTINTEAEKILQAKVFK